MKLIKNLFNIKSEYYKSCSELPLYNFIKILVFNDLSYLIIKGKPRNLHALWNDIFEEYVKLTGDEKQSELLMLYKETAFLSNKIFLVQSIVYSLRIQYSKELQDMLIKQGFRIDLNVKDLSSYQKKLDNVLTQLKKVQSDLDRRKEEIKKHDTGEKVSESYYDEVLSELSKFQGYRLNSKEISVSEFVSIRNRYNKYVKDQLKKQQKKNG